jgi:triosephosphate isomerase
MLQIFINLKRFEVSRRSGGVCDLDSPTQWIDATLRRVADLGLGAAADRDLVFLLPEALIAPAIATLAALPAATTRHLAIGCQSVHRDDIRPGGNFGAFTSGRPATAMTAIGCRWTMIGHSEERRDIAGVIDAFAAATGTGAATPEAIAATVGGLLNRAVLRALEAGLDVLVCVGETAAERGDGTPEEQRRRVEAVLSRQVGTILAGVAAARGERRVALAYEPVWAIGPGKVPPGPDYIAFAADIVKRAAGAVLGAAPTVVYGGGLKEENAAVICAVPAIDGGLVALTRFSGAIGFFPDDLDRIVAAALSARPA